MRHGVTNEVLSFLQKIRLDSSHFLRPVKVIGPYSTRHRYVSPS
jgi:hypothetical protein